MAAVNPCDPALAPVRCWEHEDCLEHPELALACAEGREAEWTVMDVGFDLYEDRRGEGGSESWPSGHGRWTPGVGDGDWPETGVGAECGTSYGGGYGDGINNDNGDGHGSRGDLYYDDPQHGWQL